MCVFCDISTVTASKMSGVEEITYVETGGWLLMGILWLLFLFQCSQKFRVVSTTRECKDLRAVRYEKKFNTFK